MALRWATAVMRRVYPVLLGRAESVLMVSLDARSAAAGAADVTRAAVHAVLGLLGPSGTIQHAAQPQQGPVAMCWPRRQAQARGDCVHLPEGSACCCA